MNRAGETPAPLNGSLEASTVFETAANYFCHANLTNGETVLVLVHGVGV